MKEIWKDIIWYEWKYQVSNLWNVKVLNFWKENILKSSKDTYWYSHISLYKNNKWKTSRIHILVAITFIPNPENKPQVNHINWIKDDNRVENLEWCTQNENQFHSFHILWNKNILTAINFRIKKFWKDHNSSKKVNQYDLEWNFIKTWDSLWDINRELWLDDSNISKCCNWKRNKVWWFIWKYFK